MKNIKKILFNKYNEILSIISSLILIFILYSQHYLDMQPCPWCILQRICLILIIINSIIFTIINKKIGIFINIIISSLGLAFSGYQFFIASSSNSCNISIAQKIIDFIKIGDIFPNIFGVWSSCRDKSYIFNISYEVYSAVLFILIIGYSILKIFEKK